MPGLFVSFALLLSLTAGPVVAQTLERVQESGTFRIGYRTDAAPFAFDNEIGEPVGFAVDLCRHVAAEVRRTLKLPDIEVEYVPVTAENRFDMVRDARIDILCGPTTVTLQRRALVDFSLFTFVDGASVLYAANGPDSFEALAGQKVAVRAGTTTEKTLRATLKRMDLEVQVVPVEHHGAGRAALEAGEIAAYFADRSILQHLMFTSEHPESLRLSDRFFTTEPYGLALALGDGRFRLAADRALSRLYRSGEIGAIFANAFGPGVDPSDILAALYAAIGLPE